MRAVMFDGPLRFVTDHPMPETRPGWARLRVRKAGICKTDMELMKGYMGFKGILGHEFVGTVEQCDDRRWTGKRVVGEINAACGKCDWCARDLGRHCPHRTVLGILNHDGCMADYCTLPTGNLLEVPAETPDDRAVLVEPLSAACEILEQLDLGDSGRAIVLGDGRLGILCSWVLSTALPEVTLVGHHPEKLRLAEWRNLKTTLDISTVPKGADLVVDATGSGSGMADAMRLCRPRGTIVLKTTVASREPLNLSPIVINEISVVGSRCGRFADGLDMMRSYPDMPFDRLITARYAIEQAVAAFERARGAGSVEVLLELAG